MICCRSKYLVHLPQAIPEIPGPFPGHLVDGLDGLESPDGIGFAEWIRRGQPGQEEVRHLCGGNGTGVTEVDQFLKDISRDIRGTRRGCGLIEKRNLKGRNTKTQ